MNIEEFGERVRSLDINNIVDESINETKDFLLHLIRSQLLSGERKDGTPIGKYSTSELGKYYVELKFDKGLFRGNSFPNYDLYFSGDYHKSLIVNITSSDIEIMSTDSKAELIETNTGNLNNALELNEKYLSLYREKLLPIILKKLHDSLGI